MFTRSIHSSFICNRQKLKQLRCLFVGGGQAHFGTSHKWEETSDILTWMISRELC